MIVHNREERLQVASIPKRFEHCNFDNWVCQNQSMQTVKSKCFNFAENFPKALERKMGGMIFYGTVGTGKTHMSIAIIRYICENFRALCRYQTVFGIISEIRETWNNRELSEKSVIQKYSNYHLLVVDEVGVQYASNAEQVLFFQVINERSLKCLPTILVSNMNEKGLNSVIGERCVDRIFENGGGTVAFNWQSFRRKM